MATRKETIVLKALDILRSTPTGMRYSDLVKNLHGKFPDFPVNTIHGTIWNLETHRPDQVYKPARGVFRHVIFREQDIEKEEKIIVQEIERAKEEEFYLPFANWLKTDVEECTRSIPLGGNKFRDKWGTPDVIGIREAQRSDIIKFTTEVVSAEIKTDTRDLITAFGQACSYKLFSHKCYIVIPRNSSQDDISRLDALCLLFGIGLVLFDTNNISEPKFEIRVRPVKQEPEMFYVNKYVKLIEKELFG